jgi:hypothetical protein
MLLYIAHKHFPSRAALGVGGRFKNATEVFVREFGVHGHKPLPDLNGRIHDVAAFEPVLQLIVFGRQDLREEIAEKQFTHAAAKFRGAHDVDQFRGGFADLVDLADFFAEITDNFCGVIKPRVHRGARLLEILGNSLTKGVKPLLEGVELLLEKKHALIGLSGFRLGAGEHDCEYEQEQENG